MDTKIIASTIYELQCSMWNPQPGVRWDTCTYPSPITKVHTKDSMRNYAEYSKFEIVHVQEGGD